MAWAFWGVYLSGVSSFGWFTFFLILIYNYAYIRVNQKFA